MRPLPLLAAAAIALLSASVAEALPFYVNGKIAYESAEDGDSEIWVIADDGSQREQLTKNSVPDEAPVWSPDGSRIAFASKRSGNWDIWVMMADGSWPLNVTPNSPSADTAPTWSPDGHKIAFTSNRASKKQIFVQDLSEIADPDPIQLTSNGRNEDPSWGWSDGEERIFFTSNRDGDDEIFSMSPIGAEVAQLTSSPGPDRRPRWSRSGRVFYQTKSGGDFEIASMTPAGGDKRLLCDNAFPDTDPAGSPDGEKIAFIRKDGTDPDLFVANAQGRAEQRLTFNAKADGAPDWHGKRRLSFNFAAVYDVVVTPRGTEVDVSFKTTKNVTDPVVELWNGSKLGGFQFGKGTRKDWSITVSFVDPATTYDLQIGIGGAKKWYYQHPDPVQTLKRRVSLTARHAFVWNDSDPGSCGEVYVGIRARDYDVPQVTTGPFATACGGDPWNFPDITMVVEDVREDTIVLRFWASEDDYPGDYEVEIAGSGNVTLELYDDPEEFTRTVVVPLDQHEDPDDDLWLDLTIDYEVEYVP
jgi:Tol biopolymer transport system component